MWNHKLFGTFSGKWLLACFYTAYNTSLKWGFRVLWLSWFLLYTCGYIRWAIQPSWPWDGCWCKTSRKVLPTEIVFPLIFHVLRAASWLWAGGLRGPQESHHHPENTTLPISERSLGWAVPTCYHCAENARALRSKSEICHNWLKAATRALGKGKRVQRLGLEGLQKGLQGDLGYG